MRATLWWVCFGVLALEGLLQVVVIAVAWPLTGDAPGAGNYSGLISIPLAIYAVHKARLARREGV